MKVLRKTVSILLLFAFLVTVFTTIGLELRPEKSDPAYLTFALFGVPLASLKYMHRIFGYGMLGLSIFHLLINYKSILNYIRKNKTTVIPSKTAIFATTFASLLFAITVLLSSNNLSSNEKDKHTTKIDIQNNPATISVEGRK